MALKAIIRRPIMMLTLVSAVAGLSSCNLWSEDKSSITPLASSTAATSGSGTSAPSTSASSQASAKVNLNVWAGGQWTGNDLANLKTFIEWYNAQEDAKSKITLTAKTEFETQLSSAIQIGRQPNIAIFDRFNVPTYVDQDYLAPIDDLISRDNISSSLFQSQAYNEMHYKEKQYGLPMDLDIWGIYVNDELFKKYSTTKTPSEGIVTWDDLEAAAKACVVTANGNISIGGYSSQDMYEHYFKYMVSTGASFLGSDGYPDYSSQAAKDVINFSKQIYDDNLSNGSTSSKEAFKNGKLAMLNGPVYYSSYFKEYAPDLKYTFIPQPKYKTDTGKQGGMIGGFGLVMPQAQGKYDTDDWKAQETYAWDFMKYWLTSEKVQLQWSQISNTLPALKSIYSSEWVQNTQVLKSAASYADNYECRPQVPGFLYIQLNVYDNYLKEYIQNGSMTLDALCDKLYTESKKIIDTYKA